MSDSDFQDDEAKAILYRLDERTERIDGQMERMSDRTTRLEGRVSAVEKDTERNNSNIRRNSTILNAMTFGLGSAIAAFWGWASGYLHL